MNKPKDFDTAKATGGYSPLPVGGYVCKITGVKEMKSAKGKDMLKIALDIAEGDEQGRFEKEFKNDTRPDKKWPNSGILYQLTYDQDGNTNGGFKSFTNCVVDSNDGFQIAWGDGFTDCFKGKLVGVLFGREQYVNQSGELRWSTKPRYFRTVKQIRANDFRVPEDKPYKGSGRGNQPFGADFGEISDEDIPF